MWPDIVEWMKRMAGQATPQAPVTRIPRTYEDSLYTITGKPRFEINNVPFTMPNPAALSGGAIAAYIPGVDATVYTKEVSQNPEYKQYIMGHELGHRLDLKGMDPILRQRFDSARAVNPRPDSESYASTNRTEHFAEAFMNAVGMLRMTNSPEMATMSPALARDWVAQHENEVPGTAVVINRLLEYPINKDHPFQHFKTMLSKPHSYFTY